MCGPFALVGLFFGPSKLPERGKKGIRLPVGSIGAKADADGAGLQCPGAFVGQRGTVESGADGDAAVCQKFGGAFAVLPRNEGNGSRLVGAMENLHPQLFKSGSTSDCLPVLGSGNGFPMGQHMADTRLQPGGAGDIDSACLQPLGQQIWHILADGFAACATKEQGRRFPAAQQQARSLRAEEAFVAGHGDKGRTQCL